MKDTITGCLALSWVLVMAGQPVAGQDAYRLVFAQVVTQEERPPTLKVSTNGPVAFRVLPATETGTAAAPAQVVARLYGVEPGELAAAVGLAPFSIAVRADGRDTVLTVTATGDVRLELRAAMRANEVEVVATPIVR